MDGIAYDPFQSDPLTAQRNNLLSRSVVPALTGPATAPVAAPTLTAPTAIQYHDPLAAIYGAGHESVLSNQPQQDKLGAAFNKFLQSAVDGADKRAEGEHAVSKIFSGAASALGGLMGGGYAQGGLQVLKQAQQETQDAKTERHLQQQEALTGMKTLADLIGNTSPYGQKALATRTKAELQKAKDSAGIDYKNETLKNKFQANEIKNYQAQTGNNHNIIKDAWQGYGLIGRDNGLDNKLLAQMTIADEMNNIRQEVAHLQAQTAENKNTAEWKKAMLNVQERWNAAKLMRRAIAENADMRANMMMNAAYSNGAPKMNNMELPSLSQGVEQDISELEQGMPWATEQPAQPAAAPAQAPAFAPQAVGTPVGRVNPAQAGGNNPAFKVPVIDTGAKKMFNLVNQSAGFGAGHKDYFLAEAQRRQIPPEQAEQIWKQLGGK